MTNRPLPGIHASIYDLSVLPEGQESLIEGAVLRANRGPVGEATLVTSPTDFLNKFTFSGQPSIKDDVTYFSILENLSQTNRIYVSRAENGALYGGSVLKAEVQLGNFVSENVESKTITVAGNCTSTLSAGNIIRVFNNSANYDYRYTVVSTELENVNGNTIITLSTAPNVMTIPSGDSILVYRTAQPQPITTQQIGVITSLSTTDNTITVTGNVTPYVLVGDLITVANSTPASVNGNYTVVSSTNNETTSTTITVKETVGANGTGGTLYRNSLANPEGYYFQSDDLGLFVNKNPGAYAQQINYSITSYTESPDDLATADTMEISLYNKNTNTLLETPYICSRNQSLKAIDGTLLYIENVLASSDYVTYIDNTAIDENQLPCNTIGFSNLGGGTDGNSLTTSDYIKALSVFESKEVPISLLINGECTDTLYQQAIIALGIGRQDIFPFLSSRLTDEKMASNTAKAQAIVNYKKGTLGSTTYLGAMYTPHLNYPDIFNSRTVKIGADAIAAAGWLQVINTKGYPYAYAGPQNGLVTGVTTDWKIGGIIGVASLLIRKELLIPVFCGIFCQMI
jgi:hypothetical protein